MAKFNTLKGNNTTITGLDPLIAKLRTFTSKSKRDIRRIQMTEVKDAYNKMRQDVPVRTGKLKSKIQIYEYRSGIIGIRANIKYAPYREFGTGKHVRVDRRRPTLVAYALTFKGQGIRQVNSKPKPYFFKNWFPAEKRIVENINQYIKDFVRTKAT